MQLELLFRVSKFLQCMTFVLLLKTICLFLSFYPPLLRCFMEMGERQSGVKNSRVKMEDVMWSFLTLRATMEQIRQCWIEAWHKKAYVGRPAPNPVIVDFKTEEKRHLLDVSSDTSKPLVVTFGSCS